MLFLSSRNDWLPHGLINHLDSNFHHEIAESTCVCNFFLMKSDTQFFFCKQLFFRGSEPRILEKRSNSKATFEPHIEKLKQLSFKMPYFSNLVPKSVRNLSNSIATFSLIFAQNISNSSLDRKMELLIKKNCVVQFNFSLV